MGLRGPDAWIIPGPSPYEKIEEGPGFDSPRSPL